MKTKILDFIDFKKVNTLLEGFNLSTGFVTAILDLEGNILSKSGWRQICSEFHRVNPESSKRCKISDTVLAGKMGKDQKYNCYKCLNGLVDVSVPIIIKGEHIANLFSGQIFIEKPDYSFFQKQAAQFGFNESSYLKALGDVPVVSEEKVKNIMEFLLNMTQLISEMTYQRIELLELNNTSRINEERHRLVHENSMDAILLTSPDGSIISANRAACAMFQRTEDEIFKAGRNGLVDLEDPRLSALVEQRDLTGKAKGELLMLRKDGTKFPVELSATVFTDHAGGTLSSIIIRDITDRKESEKRLYRNNKILQLFIENVPAAIAMFDCEMKYLAYSKRYLSDYNLGERELKGLSHYDIFPDMPQRWKEIHSRCIAGAIEVCDEDIYPRANGKIDWLRWAIHPWYQTDEKIGGIILFSEVITDRKLSDLLIREKTDEIEAQNEEYLQLNEELHQTNKELQLAIEKAEESDRLKTAFLQNMSHEIRTPMNAIIGFSNLLVENIHDETRLIKYTGIISQRCKDLLNIINDILDISKIESGQLSINPEYTTLGEIFAELSAFFGEYQQRADKQHIKFSFNNACSPTCSLVTDKVKLMQIFINLISNAFKFTDEGKIECGCKFDTNKNLMFYVTDTGIGIPLDKHQYVFERFIQLQQNTRKNTGGTGLGLSIVKALVNLLGGQITLESEPGKGSTFSFTIPCITSQQVSIPQTVVENLNEINFNGKTILIVEDDHFNAVYLKEILSGYGLNIMEATNGNQAVEIALSTPLDLILMDISLTDLDGYEATRLILQQNPI